MRDEYYRLPIEKLVRLLFWTILTETEDRMFHVKHASNHRVRVAHIYQSRATHG